MEMSSLPTMRAISLVLLLLLSSGSCGPRTFESTTPQDSPSNNGFREVSDDEPADDVEVTSASDEMWDDVEVDEEEEWLEGPDEE